jgi:hypothetical protein
LLSRRFQLEAVEGEEE